MKHLSILAIQTKSKRNVVFTFNEVSLKEVEKETKLLKLNKVSQYSDLLTKIIKENSGIF